MNSVQNDIWTLLAVPAVGAVPLGVVLFLLSRKRPFEPSGGKGPSAASEAIFENEAYTFKEEPVEGIPGDSPLTWWRRALYEAAVLGVGLSCPWRFYGLPGSTTPRTDGRRAMHARAMLPEVIQCSMRHRQRRGRYVSPTTCYERLHC